MSYSYNQRKKIRRRIQRLSVMTVDEYNNLQPNKFKSHKKIIEFMEEHKIKPINTTNLLEMHKTLVEGKQSVDQILKENQELLQELLDNKKY